MAYIDTAYLFKCQTCRHFRSDECNTFCENGECYSPNMRMIPSADVVKIKYGEWEAYGLRNPKCSICHSYNIEKSRYCPNCGARMDSTPKERGAK